MIFWHESSATEPGGTARDSRAHEPGAANIPAMPVAGAAPLINVPQARAQFGAVLNGKGNVGQHPVLAVERF